jgi:hypothetical protein
LAPKAARTLRAVELAERPQGLAVGVPFVVVLLMLAAEEAVGAGRPYPVRAGLEDLQVVLAQLGTGQADVAGQRAGDGPDAGVPDPEGIVDGGPGMNFSVIGEDQQVVSLRLWRADAVVLFDWLMSVDMNAVPAEHPAQRQALTDLLAWLEMQTDGTSASVAQVAAAQAEVVSGVD